MYVNQRKKSNPIIFRSQQYFHIQSEHITIIDDLN
jgi:hypothetical protein